jgi:hypothetical protein
VTVRYGWRPEDRDVVAVAPPAVDPGRRRRNRTAAATVVAVVLVTAGVAAWLTFTDAHRSPRAVAEAFLTANERHDWATSWELLCRTEQLRHESFAVWSELQDLRVEIRSPALEAETVTVEDVRPNERSARPSYIVDLEHDLGSAVYFDTLLVVEEDGEYRTCGQP